MDLLIDFGNSRIKWAWWDGCSTVRESGAQAHDGLAIESALIPICAENLNPGRIIASSVLSLAANEAIASALDQRFGIPVEFQQARAEFHGIHSAYRVPENLGVDRLVAMLAVRHHYPGDSLIVDCGTAVTIDALKSNGEHLGGLIVPGLGLMRQALLSKAPGIRRVEGRDTVLFGRNTGEAIASGTLRVLSGGIERTLSDMSRKLDAEHNCLICGGDAVQLASLFKNNAVIDQDLVLKGLAVCTAN